MKIESKSVAAKLFVRLKNNDLDAFNSIYSLYSKKILKFAYSFTITLEDAEEVVQDTFLKLWNNRHNLEIEKSCESLLFVISKNLVLNKIKQYSVKKAHYNIYIKEQNDLYESLEEKLNFNEVETILNDIIAGLPEKRRQIFTLNRFKGLTYVEIARFLNISQGTVEKQMKKALETVNERFRNY